MSNIKGIFDKIYVGSNISDDQTNIVKINGNISTTGNLGIGSNNMIYFGNYDINNSYGIKDDNGTLKYKNQNGIWTNFFNLNNNYINFSNNFGQYPENPESGFGIRNNQGILEFKNSSGNSYTTWTTFGTGSGGSGGSGSVGNVAGQLFFSQGVTLVGGVELDVNLTTSMTQMGKIHCDVWEFVEDTGGNVDNTWKIEKNDSNFIMYNFQKGRTATITLSAFSPVYSYVTLTSSINNWTNDDIGLEFCANNGSAVITTINSNTSVTGIIKNVFTETPNPISDWKLYAGSFNDDGTFNITSTKSLQGIYRIIPYGIVNLYGMSLGASSANNGRTIDHYSCTGLPPGNGIGTNWPISLNSSNDPFNKISVGHNCVMYNPLIAVNNKINMIAVASSGMFYKYLLCNNTTDVNFKDKTSITLTLGSPQSYYSQELLYFIKDGYTVTKREKIFPSNLYTPSAGVYGGPEYGSGWANSSGSSLVSMRATGNILSHFDGVGYSYTVFSLSIIAVDVYFVICGIVYKISSGIVTTYLIVCSYNSRGEIVNYITVRATTSITANPFYPKIFNGNNNDIWLFYYNTNTNSPYVQTLNFLLLIISSSGNLSIYKSESTLFTPAIIGGDLHRPYATFINGYVGNSLNTYYKLKYIQYTNTFYNLNSYNNSSYFGLLNRNDYPVNSTETALTLFTAPNSATAFNTGYNNFLTDNFSTTQLSRYLYVDLDVVKQNNYIYVIFSSNTFSDQDTYGLYYAFFSTPDYTTALTNYTNVTNKLTDISADTIAGYNFTNYVQVTPKCIYDSNSRRILIVWLGKSQNDVTIGYQRSTYYKFINLNNTDTTTNNNISSITAAVRLTSNVPGAGGYYNLVQKSNGNIHLLFNTGHNSIYEYVLPVNSSIFYTRLSPTRNIKHSMGYNKILPGVTYDGFVRASYTGKLSVGIYNDKIVGVGQLINPDLASVMEEEDFISSYINYSSNKYYQKSGDASNVHSVPTTSTYFYEVTSTYEWNIANRISDSWITQTNNNLGDFSDTDINQSIFKIYNKIFYVVFTCVTSVATSKKLFFSYSSNYGQSWSYPIRVTTNSISLYPENNPDMIIDSSGNMHIVFESTTDNTGTTNTQIYYVKGTNLPNPTFTDIYASYNSNNNLTSGISGISTHIQSNPRIVKCGDNNLAVCWEGNNSTYQTTKKIFVGTHSQNGDTTQRWIVTIPINVTEWQSYSQTISSLHYNDNGILVLSWLGKQTQSYFKIFIAISVDKGSNFTPQTNSFVNSSNTVYNSDISTYELYLDNSNMIHIMFLISSNVITNTGGYYNYISGIYSSTTAQTPQSDIFVTRASLGSINSSSSNSDITSALANLTTSNKWSDPYLLTNNRYNIPNYQNSTYGSYGNGMQILPDNNNVIYYIYKMRFMNYGTDLYNTALTNPPTYTADVQGGNGDNSTNKPAAYLTFCTFDGIKYSDVTSIMNEYFYSYIYGDVGSSLAPASSTSNRYYQGYITGRDNRFYYEFSFTIDIDKYTNNIYLLCNALYYKYYGANMTPKTNMYLYEYTQNNKFFGVLDYRPILNYDKLVDALQPRDTYLQDLNPYTIILNNGIILCVYSSANGTASSTGSNLKGSLYLNGIVSYYNPNNNTKFQVRSNNSTFNNFTYSNSPYEFEYLKGPSNGTTSTSTMTQKFAGTIATDNDYWTSFTLTNIAKSSQSTQSVIILGVCQDPQNTTNIYILYRTIINVTMAPNIQYSTTSSGNLFITYTNTYSNTLSTSATVGVNQNFGSEIQVTLANNLVTGDTNNTVTSGSIFAYNNVVYVVYTNGTGKLFLSRLSYTSSTGVLSLANTSYISNTAGYSTTPLNAGEGMGVGKHVIDYSLGSDNMIILHVLYHGTITNRQNNKVYYYFNINISDYTNAAVSYTVSSLECVVPSLYQNNSAPGYYSIGYGDMIVDRINNKIHVVYSTHNFPTNLTSGPSKEHNRFIVYTYKDMNNISTSQFSENTQYDICSGTNSGLSQAIYKNPNQSTSQSRSSCDQYPKLFLKNNILHMVTLGFHYNGYFGSTGSTNVNHINYYFKDLSNQNSKFVNNNQPVNKSLYFNISDNSTNIPNYNDRQYYYYQKYPSIVVDDNNTIHVIANIPSLYTHNSDVKSYRNYHFLTTDDATYKKDTYVSTITKSNNTSKWTDIKDFILSDSPNSQTAFYSICFQYSNYDNWYVFNNTISRLILQYNYTNQQFFINTNSTYNNETLTAYSDFLTSDSINEKTIKSLENAITYTANQMTSQQLNSASNFGFTNSTVTNIKFAVMLKTNNPYISPQTSDLTINYSLAGYLKNVTNDYIIKIKSTNVVSFTPPNDGQTRTAYIYITDGSSAGNTATTVISYTEIIQNVETITQIIQPQTILVGYTKLIITNNQQYYLTNNNISNGYYSINGSLNNIVINNPGNHKIDVSFDYNVSNNSTMYFSIDGINQEALKSNNITDIYDRVVISKVQSVSSSFNFNLYMKSESSIDTTISIKNLKIFIQKL